MWCNPRAHRGANKIIRLLSASVVLVLGLAACGSTAGSSPPSAQGAGSSQPSFEGYLGSGSGFVEFLSLVRVTGHGEFFPLGNGDRLWVRLAERVRDSRPCVCCWRSWRCPALRRHREPRLPDPAGRALSQVSRRWEVQVRQRLPPQSASPVRVLERQSRLRRCRKAARLAQWPSPTAQLRQAHRPSASRRAPGFG
jgi:hypothetical protein